MPDTTPFRLLRDSTVAIYHQMNLFPSPLETIMMIVGFVVGAYLSFRVGRHLYRKYLKGNMFLRYGAKKAKKFTRDAHNWWK